MHFRNMHYISLNLFKHAILYTYIFCSLILAAIVYLTLDATSYNAFEDVPTVEVCVEGSLHAGYPDDIAGSSFVVDLSLVPGTAVGKCHYYTCSI